MEQSGFVLIADITGYTRYLSRSELEHAQETLTELLGVLVEHTRPPLVISALEGDAVFSYALADGLTAPQTFVETIEDTYVAFRRAVELMVLNNTCRCNACANVSSLDLKLFLHYGTFAVQTVGDRQQIVGTDVNLIHRLLKNTVTAATGLRAYLLCTESAERALGIPDLRNEMVLHREAVDDVGGVTVWVKDMHPVYQERRERDDPPYTVEEVIGSAVTHISLPPQLVWDYLNQSEFRNLLYGSDRFEIRDRRNGRVGAGTTFQCYHGTNTVPQLVVEWRPFERVILEQLLPLPGRPARLLLDLRLEDVEGGTRLTSTAAKPTGPLLKRVLVKAMVKMQKRQAQREIERFRDAIEAHSSEYRTTPSLPAPGTEEIRRQASASLEQNG